MTAAGNRGQWRLWAALLAFALALLGLPAAAALASSPTQDATTTSVGTVTRYYGVGGAKVAVRAAGSLTWLASDGQNSRQIAVDATTGAATRTYYLPYGAVRAGAPALPTDQNFLGRVLDSSGLLQDGARYYDPSLGQFISPDPLANASDNSTLDPYGYAASNPAAGMDPTGLMNQPEGGGFCGSMSLSQCGSVEKTVATVTHLLDAVLKPNFMDKVGSALDAVGDDVTDIGVQALNDTKDGAVGLINGVKNALLTSEPVCADPNCEESSSAGPLISDLAVPDVPQPFPFTGPKSLLKAAGTVVSLLAPLAVLKLGKFFKLLEGAESEGAWFEVTKAGANRAGTYVPESFDLSVAGERFSVVPNATKHIAEYATGTGSGSMPMSSFAGAVEAAVKQGLAPGRNFIRIGSWELGIDTTDNVIYHAVYRP